MSIITPDTTPAVETDPSLSHYVRQHLADVAALPTYLR